MITIDGTLTIGFDLGYAPGILTVPPADEMPPHLANKEKAVTAWKHKFAIPLSNRKELERRCAIAKREAIDWLVEKINYISFPIFEACLQTAMRRIATPIERSIILVEPEKSSLWAARLARLWSQSPYAYLRMGEKYASALSNTLKTLPTHFDKEVLRNVIIIEDASYSGFQLTSTVIGANEVLQEEGIIPTFYLVVPFISRAALRAFDLLREKGLNIELYYQEIMPTVEEIIAEKSEEEKNILTSVLWPQHKKHRGEYASRISMTYFSHKTPNSLSFPNCFVDVGLVPDMPTPYKNKATMLTGELDNIITENTSESSSGVTTTTSLQSSLDGGDKTV